MDEPTGDLRQMEVLFKAYQTALCNVAYNMVLDRDTAKDIVQEVFIQLWRNKDSIEFGPAIKGYLFKATTHLSLNYLQKEKKTQKFSNEIKSQFDESANHNYESVEIKEMEFRIREAIEKLPPKCKAIYLLSRHEGLSYKQIAEHLELSPKTIENQMGIALEKLRNALKPFLTKEFLEIALLATFSHLMLELIFS